MRHARHLLQKSRSTNVKCDPSYMTCKSADFRYFRIDERFKRPTEITISGSTKCAESRQRVSKPEARSRKKEAPPEKRGSLQNSQLGDCLEMTGLRVSNEVTRRKSGSDLQES